VATGNTGVFSTSIFCKYSARNAQYGIVEVLPTRIVYVFSKYPAHSAQYGIVRYLGHISSMY
jgi:hypothetical protein